MRMKLKLCLPHWQILSGNCDIINWPPWWHCWNKHTIVNKSIIKRSPCRVMVALLAPQPGIELRSREFELVFLELGRRGRLRRKRFRRPSGVPGRPVVAPGSRPNCLQMEEKRNKPSRISSTRWRFQEITILLKNLLIKSLKFCS